MNPDPQHYYYTRQGKSILTSADKSDFQSTLNACKTLGFSEFDIKTTWKIVAAILQLVHIFFFLISKQNLLLNNNCVIFF